jgi:hypothetical protein
MASLSRDPCLVSLSRSLLDRSHSLSHLLSTDSLRLDPPVVVTSPSSLYREEVFALRNELCLVDAGQWSTAKAAFESHHVSDAVYFDVLCAAAHASFSHPEHAIAEYLDAEGLGEAARARARTTQRTTDMQDANFAHDLRRPTDE